MIEEIFSLDNFFQLSYELQTGDKDTWLHSPLQVVRTQLEDHTQALVGITDKVHLDSHLLAVLSPSDFDTILDNLAAVVVVQFCCRRHLAIAVDLIECLERGCCSY